jgi:hypothetical protein
MSFEYEGHPLAVGAGSNYFSQEPGVGGILLLEWLRIYPMAMVVGGTEDTQRLLGSAMWSSFGGIRRFQYGRMIKDYAEDSLARALVKKLARWAYRCRRLRLDVGRASWEERIGETSVLEVGDFSRDMLPTRSLFRFRFAPTLDELRWRYSPNLPFVRYRIFRIVSDHDSLPSGYVVLREGDRRLVVAHCDGEDPAVLAYGILLSIGKVLSGRRDVDSVHLYSGHHSMARLFEQCGFAVTAPERKIALRAQAEAVKVASDTSNWLVSADWGDEGLMERQRL